MPKADIKSSQLQQDTTKEKHESAQQKQQKRLLPKVLFENLKRMAKAIVATLGNQCEVIIHDFTDLERSIIWIEGDITGRQIGGSLTDLGIRKVRDKEYDDLTNYQTRAPDGRTLKSSSVFLRNDKGQVVGAFCVNWDVSTLVAAEQVLENLTLFTHDEPIEETFVDDVTAILESMIEEAIAEVGKPFALMEKSDKVALVKTLDQKGAFQFRRAVPIVAERLGVTRQTIYNYLGEVESHE